MSPRSRWVAPNVRPTVSEDGVLTAMVPVVDDGRQVGTVRVTLTAERALRVLVDGVELSDFAAWSTR